MVPYSALIGRGHAHDGRFVEVLEGRLRQLLKHFLYEVEIDEEWYLSNNDDVRHAVQMGLLASGRDHYAAAGYFEDRQPRPVIVDEDWYLLSYPDVAEAIRSGYFRTGQQHFDVSGFQEGRLPSADWSLRRDNNAELSGKLAASR